MDFEYDALKAVQRTAALVKNPKGKKMNINPDTIVVCKGFPVSQRAKEILGALAKAAMPGSADRDGAAVPTYKILELSLGWESNTSYWYAFDSSMKNDMYGLQYKESQGISLEGPNVVLTFKHLLQETVIEQLYKFRENLTAFMGKTILSEAL